MKTLNAGYWPPNKVAQYLDISTDTLYRWYNWWNSDLKKPEGLYLPPLYYLDRKRTKYIKEEDLHYLVTFRDNIRGPYKGAMSEYNAARLWGKRGVRSLTNKGLSKADIKHQFN